MTGEQLFLDVAEAMASVIPVQGETKERLFLATEGKVTDAWSPASAVLWNSERHFKDYAEMVLAALLQAGVATATLHGDSEIVEIVSALPPFDSDINDIIVQYYRNNVAPRDIPEETITSAFERVRPKGEWRTRQAVKAPSHEKHEPTYAVQRVFFATDREELSMPGTFGTKRSTKADPLTYGVTEVSIPRTHRPGHIESPSILRFEFRDDPEKHIVILNVRDETAQEMFDDVRAASTSDSKALVFIHGYNVSFANAVRRTAQMAYDLSYDGAAIAYSWPSKQKKKWYLADEATIEWSEPHFEQFLRDLATRAQITTIHLIAHSMGNRAAARAVANLGSSLDGAKIKNLVLAAPDIDSAMFLQLADALARNAENVTLYASSHDRALEISKTIHDSPRAGDCHPEHVVIHEGIDTIDASAVDTDLLGHGYFSSERSLLTDIEILLRGQRLPRPFLHAVQVQNGKYWKFV